MSRCLTIPCRFFLATGVLTLVGSGLLQAETTKSASKSDTPDGYKDLPVKTGDSTGYIRVKEEADPFKNVKQSAAHPGKYEPWNMSLGKESPMATRSFTTPTSATSKQDAAAQSSYTTKPYAGLDQNNGVPTSESKAVPLKNSEAYNNSARGLGKDFGTSKSTMNSDKGAEVTSRVPSEQDRTSADSGKTSKTFGFNQSDKTYTGEGAQAVRDDVKKLNQGLLAMKDLPNRPLTIDEVRALINHGFKPNTDEKPDETSASKPMNDPDYKPEPLRDLAPPPPEEDKDFPVPSPGTMAKPENAEPLPQR